MIKEEFKYFLSHGHLKWVEFGITRSKLIELLGTTNWIYKSPVKAKLPSIYKYGKMEFYYMSDKPSAGLVGVIYQPLTQPGDKGFLQFNYNGWNKNTEINVAIEYLNTNNIQFTETHNKYSFEARYLKTETGISLIFDGDEIPGKYLLHKISKFVDWF